MDDTTPAGGVGLLEETFVAPDKGWVAILYNDPINLFEVVVERLVQILEISHEKALEHAKMAHDTGKAAVFHGSKEEVDLVVEQLGSVQLRSSREEA